MFFAFFFDNSRPCLLQYRQGIEWLFFKNILIKRLPILIAAFASLACFSIILAGSCAWAVSGARPGSGNRGLTLGLAYDVSHLEYKEKDSSGNFLDEDTAYLSGLSGEARYETGTIWTRVTAQYCSSGWAKYDGATQDGTPLVMYTKEKIYQYEGDLGYKALNASTATLTPYIGIGYRIWDRGSNALPDYEEKYTWNYGSVGFDYVLRLSRWTAGANAAIRLPFNMKMRTSLAGNFDEATFYLKKRAGFAVELPVTYEFYRYQARPAFFAYLSPYYQYWGIGASDPVVMTKGGVPLPGNTYYEPDSRADIFGARAGIGINY